MKKIISPAFLICVLTLLSSCAHYYYAPNAANIPMFKEKNTFKGKVGYSSDNYNGADIQIAYSASKNIGIMVNSFFAGKTEQVQNDISTSATHQESGKGSYIEIGAGYYKPFGAQKVWIFEIYAGAGVGGEKHTYANSETANLHLNKFFIQPSVGYSSKSGHLEVGLSSRFSILNLKVKKSNLAFDANQDEKENLDAIMVHPSSLLWEPSVIVGAGWQDFKFYLQLTPSNKLNNSYLSMDMWNMSFGIKFSIKNDQKKDKANSNHVTRSMD
ncbi:MAG: hypothetical protein ABIP35_14230 [Ginsengibacter sp.]